MRGMFTSLLSGAANGRGAANMWQSLREGAYSWAEGVLNVTSATPPTEEDIQALGARAMSHVTIMDMNRYVKLAGEYLRAKDNLMNRPPGDQIMGDSIVNLPWSTTADNPAIPTRYRLRVQRQITYRGIGTTSTSWATYELQSPLTNVTDALNYADQLWSLSHGDSGKRATSAEITGHLQYVIETV